MMEILKHMIKRAWGIIVSCNATWDEIATEKASVSSIRKQYIYPWFAVAIILSFLFGILYNNSLEITLLSTIITALFLFGGYFISNMICFAYLKKKQPELASKTDCETIIAYSYTIIILIKITTIIIPRLFFLNILSVFTGYVIWEGCRAIWMLKEEDRGNIVLVFSIVVIFIPIIINKIIHLMLPNA